MNDTLYSELKKTIENLNSNQISENRLAVLQPLSQYIQERVNEDQKIRLHFICTHNSRRSHFSQVWAQTLALYFNIENVLCYSGGTAVTALFPLVAQTFKKNGFHVEKISRGDNPIYTIKYAENEPALIGFSKTVEDNFNPQSCFAAIMTCSHADSECPLVNGAEARFPINFEDPKAFDDSPLNVQKYNEKSLEIATELFYVFSKIKTSKS